jgi:homoserine dehydrogenase
VAENGFAEADPTFDLDGTDATHKLVIVARTAFGVDLDFADVRRRGIDRLDPQEVRAACEAGGIVRLVASCRRTLSGGVEAEVGPVRLAADHPLAQPRNEENRALVQPESGMPLVVEGKGAGRWPTAESVVADVLDVFRLRRACLPEPVQGFVATAGWESGVPLGVGAA